MQIAANGTTCNKTVSQQQLQMSASGREPNGLNFGNNN